MTPDRKKQENKFECVSCGVDTFSEQVNGPIITRNKHKDWCLLAALWRLDESVKSKPWRVAVQDLTEVCEKYAAEKFAASIRAETLEEAAKIADNFGPSRPLGVSASHSILCRGRWEGEQAASKNIASAIRDAGKKE